MLTATQTSTRNRSHRRGGRLGRRSGNAVLDLAFILPILLALTMGAVQYGYALFVKHALQGAAREGARAAIVGAVMVLAQSAAQGKLRTLLKNTAVLAVNLLHVKDVGLDHVAETGQATRTVNLRLPYAVPLLIAVALLLAHDALPGKG